MADLHLITYLLCCTLFCSSGFVVAMGWLVPLFSYLWGRITK